MSYDYFLFRPRKFIADPATIDETTLDPWGDPSDVRRLALDRIPGLQWPEDRGWGAIPDEFFEVSYGGGLIVSVRTSHRRDSRSRLEAVAIALNCMAFDTQTGEIVWQPAAGAT